MTSSYLTMVLMILTAMLPTTTARTAPHTAATASLSWVVLQKIPSEGS